MITASKQIDRVANSLTDLAQSRAIPAREIKSLVLRLDRVANTLDRRVAMEDPADAGGPNEEKIQRLVQKYPGEDPKYIEKVVNSYNGDMFQAERALKMRQEQKGMSGMSASKKKFTQR